MRTTSRTSSGKSASNLAGELLWDVPTESLYRIAGRLIPWASAAALLFGALGLYIAFFVAPSDARQGEMSRILFVHVPAAWLSLFLFFVLGGLAAAGAFFQARLPTLLASAMAPTGALLTFLALWTGAIWGKPNWGAWWVWDARLTCELVLLVLYLGFMALHSLIGDRGRADRAAALFGLIGASGLPLIYFSLQWWNALHQGTWASAARSQGMASAILAGMVLMTLALLLYSVAASLSRLRSEILEREHASDWVAALITEPA